MSWDTWTILKWHGRHQEYNWKICSDLIDEIFFEMADRARKKHEMNMAGFIWAGFAIRTLRSSADTGNFGGEIITVDLMRISRITSPTSMRTGSDSGNSVVSVLYDIYRQKAKIFEDQLSCLAIQNKRLLRSKSQKRIGKT